MMACCKAGFACRLQPPNLVGDAPDLVHRKSIDMVSVINARYVQFAEANVGKWGRRRTRPMQQGAPEFKKL